MVRPAPSSAHVPFGEVLPYDYMGAEASCGGWRPNSTATLRLAIGRPGTGIRSGESPSIPGRGRYLLLVDTTITLYDTRDDWLELALDIAWLAQPSSV